ncbi:Efflux pump notK' [Cladobotryum mycophilum]|uniref:Efflux pump notK n=1 Tax=Cladobotryum mycophilum TaxID=491253 RepID=A0ABR0T3R0_9HYPO
MGWIQNTNAKVAASPVGWWFRLDGSGHPKERKGSYFFTEIRAGLATFFAMAYIIAVNASIVSDSGGTCVCNGGSSDPLCNNNEEYSLCLQGIKRDVVTATAAISALSSFMMGLFANLPIGLAPGMGLNAYFTYTVVGYHGSGLVPYNVALTAIFVEGFIFLALAIFGLRQWLARAIPHSIKIATGVGIGLFLTIIGLTYSEGIGLIVGSTSTPLSLAGCSPQNKLADGTCPEWDKMRYPAMWIGIFCGGILTVILMLYRVKGAIIAGIILVSKVVDFHRIENILVVQDWDVSKYGGHFGLALITFLYVDILDTTGTLYGMARFAKLIDPVTQDFEGSAAAYMVDALSISIGSLFGVPPVTAFVESGAGISEGGKTGLTAMRLLRPHIRLDPPWATGCVLILVGSMMATSVTEINWKYMGDAVPAFLAIVIMPFTYSIAYGLIASIMAYIAINTFVWLLKLVSGGRIVPPNLEDKENWTWRIPGGFFPPWLVRLFQGKKDFWREPESHVGAAAGKREQDTSSDHDPTRTVEEFPAHKS